MQKVTLNTGPAPEILILTARGDLRLTGWERGEVYAESDSAHGLRAQEAEGRVTLEIDSDCSLRVPRQARVTLRETHGDLRVKGLSGELQIGTANGDVTLRRTGPVSLEVVNGDVSAKKVGGDLRVGSASADLSVRGVAGLFQADQVSADLYLRDVSGPARARVGADLVLNLDFAAGQDYDFTAGGDILCRLGPSAAAAFDVTFGGDLSVDVPEVTEAGEGNHRSLSLRGGGAAVNLRAGGDLSLTEVSADPEAMGTFGDHFGDEFGVMAEELASQIETQVESQIESQMAEFEKQLNERMAGLNTLLGAQGVNAEVIADRVRRKAEAAARRAELKAEAARRRAERQAERARHRTAFAWTFPTPPPAPGAYGDRGAPPVPPMAPARPAAPSRPAAPVEPVSEEERLSILRMLEQGRISVDQAEKLLAALEGRK